MLPSYKKQFLSFYFSTLIFWLSVVFFFIYKEMYVFNVCNLISLDICKHLWYYSYNQERGIFDTSQFPQVLLFFFCFCLYIGTLNIVKISILSKPICRFNTISIKIPKVFFTEIEENPKVYVESQKTQAAE